MTAKSPKSILIVDDDKDFTDSLAALLKDRYRIDVASNGFSAIGKLRKGDFDLVLLDVVMPGLDGPGFLEEVRKERPGLPVILMSALADLAGNARRLGIEDFLTKPLDFKKLETRIRRHFDS